MWISFYCRVALYLFNKPLRTCKYKIIYSKFITWIKYTECSAWWNSTKWNYSWIIDLYTVYVPYWKFEVTLILNFKSPWPGIYYWHKYILITFEMTFISIYSFYQQICKTFKIPKIKHLNNKYTWKPIYALKNLLLKTTHILKPLQYKNSKSFKNTYPWIHTQTRKFWPRFAIGGLNMSLWYLRLKLCIAL